MNQKCKEPNYLRLIGIPVLVLVLAAGVFMLKSRASDSPSTSLTIANTVPATPTGVHERQGSDALHPVDEGDTVTIEGSSSDANGDQWTLLVCADTAGVTGTGCNGATWCSSSPEDSGSPNSCDIPTSGVSTESNPWYAYACDAEGCSSGYSTGNDQNGDRNSPFAVNHAPTFAMSNDSSDNSKGPGDTVTFTATAIDKDVDGTQDAMTLYVCKSTTDLDNCFPGGNNSNRWCVSDETAGNGSSSVSVNCNSSLASVKPHGTYSTDYYSFLIDSHSFMSSSDDNGAATPVIVKNVAPVVSGISMVDRSGSGDIALDPTKPGDTSTGYKVVFTATDNNSCSLKGTTGGNSDFAAAPEIIADSTKANLRMTAIAKTACAAGGDANSDNCIPQISCTQDADSCTGLSDPTATFTCNFSLAYHANPTALGAATGPYDSEKWRASVLATDIGALDSGLVDGNAGNGTENELDQFLAFAARGSDGTSELTEIAYSTMSANAVTANGDAPNSKLVALGNTGIDQKLSGTDMTCSGGSCLSVDPLPKVLVSVQKYGTANDFNYGTSTDALSGSATAFGYCAKPSSAAGAPNISSFWKIKVPAGLTAGTYSGTDTIIGTVSDNGSHAW